MGKAEELIIRWSKSNYVRQRGMTIREVNKWLKGEGIDSPWTSIHNLLEELVKEGELTRTTSVGGKRISYPGYVYWPKESEK